jgi:hypothetical protein
MGTGILAVLAIGGAFLIFCLTRGQKMREEKRPWPELFWYAGGLIPLTIVTIVWTAMENQAVPQRVLLIALGAALGGLGLYALGEYLRPVMPAVAEANPPTIAQTTPPPGLNVTGNNNVVTVGVIAGTYINQAPQPELKLVEQNDVINADGTHTTTFTVEVVSQLTPSFLAIDLAATGILDANIVPPPVGGVSTMILRNVRRSSTSYHAELTSPRGRYFVTVHTQSQTPVNLNYQF